MIKQILRLLAMIAAGMAGGFLAQMFLFGTEIDWVEDKLQAGFVFRNPNEKGRCGCGESFHV